MKLHVGRTKMTIYLCCSTYFSRVSVFLGAKTDHRTVRTSSGYYFLLRRALQKTFDRQDYRAVNHLLQ